ncbi:MAG TPA: heme-degrading domain-containing protein [Ktedonobacteraceae bacterium]
MGEYDELLTILLAQESELQFSEFSNETALEVGLALLKAARDLGKAVTIDITRNGQQLFHYSMNGTSADNDSWVRRKSNTVQRFGRSSYAMGIALKNAGLSIEQKYLLPESEFAPHGGSFPLSIRHVGVVGTITVSGLPQAEDHELVITTLRAFLAKKPQL